MARTPTAATKLGEGDAVVSVMPMLEQNSIVLQTKEGFFLKFDLSEIPEKKKAAVGVRAMKLGLKDTVENVYYVQNAVESTIEYKGKNLVLNHIKSGKRDGKGTRIRIYTA